MMIQRRAYLFKRPFRVLLSLVLVGSLCGSPLLAQSSKKSSSRSSSSRSARSSSQRSSSQLNRVQTSQPQRSSSIRSSSSRPKFQSSTTSKRPSRTTRPNFNRVPQQTTPKISKTRPSRPQKTFKVPNIKVAPPTTRPNFKIPNTGRRPGSKGTTKDIKPKIPSLKIPNRKVPDRKIPNLKIPDRKVGNGKFVPKPGNKVVRPRPGKNNDVFKPGKGTFVPKPGKGNSIPPVKGISKDDLIGKPGKRPGNNSRVPGKIDLSKIKGLSKGKGNLNNRFPKSNKWLGKNGVPLSKDLFKGKNIKPINMSVDKQLKIGKLKPLMNSKKAQQWNLKKQFQLHKKGDVARQLNLHKNLLKHGGWRNRTLFGQMANTFTTSHFGCWYAGPGCYPTYCWSPHWCDWVDWCWWDWCHPICDPRPIICRPIFCEPCVPWNWYACPIWQPLPVVTCGTWVDVNPVVINSGLDLQMLAVRFVDSGHSEEELGPRFRVWFRNNSDVDINVPFNVMLFAANSRELTTGLPEAGSRVDNIAAGQIQSVDIRLPFAASTMSTDAEGNAVPFEQLHVLIDSHREIPEAFEENNGAIMARVDVLSVDPALFSTDTEAVLSGSLINLAGEGLGPEPGKVLVSINGMNFEAEIHGWYDLGVRVKLPELPLLDSAEATLVVVRGDGAASNPIDVQFAPQVAAIVVE
ncbi:hypothetical protein [Gimesia aquarii]|nr:hypothetical protein [Gimesia aquarii]